MSAFVLHPDALADLNQVWEFTAPHNPGAVDRVLTKFSTQWVLLVSFPEIGHVRADLKSWPLRFRAVRDFLIVYAPDEEPLLVMAVLHGGRNPASLQHSSARDEIKKLGAA